MLPCRVFPSKYIDALGCLVQDGGVGEFNNPARPADWEGKI